MLKQNSSRRSDLPVASLADIAFLLLIFFLVTTTIAVDMGIGLTLPGKNTKVIPQRNVSHLLVNADGDILLDDAPVSLPGLHAAVGQKLQENPNLVISVKTNRRTAYNVFIQVLDELKIAGASRISIAEPAK